MSSRDTLYRLLIVACLILASVRVGLPVLRQVTRRPAGDLLSYYYGARVAVAGGNPYQLSELNELAQRETGRAVNPYLYPPPFLLLCAPLASLPVEQARLVWFAFELACLLGCFVVLHRILRKEGEGGDVLLLLAFVAATLPAPYENLVMGQVNSLVLLLLLLGLMRLTRGGDLSGGALLGAVAIVKMSPGLLVVWLLVKRRWRAVAAAGGSAVVLSLLTLPLVGPGLQWFFYGSVLPGFSKRFPDVGLRVDWFGNHSLPSLFNALLPGGHPRQLSSGARIATLVAELALLAAILFWLRRPTTERRAFLSEASILLVLMVAFPVFTFEHHFVYLLLPLGLSTLAVARGALAPRWGIGLGLAYALLAIRPSEFQLVEVLGREATGVGSLVATLFSKAKLTAMAVLLLAVVQVRRSSGGARSPATRQGET